MCEEGSKIHEKEDKVNVNVGSSDEVERDTTSTSAQTDCDSVQNTSANDVIDSQRQNAKSAEDKTLEEIKEVSQTGDEHAVDPNDNVFKQESVNIQG